MIGLGNPGPKYAGTRHNVGAAAVRRLADRLGVRLSSARGPARWSRATHPDGSPPMALAVPETYMNRSGAAARFLLEELDLAPADLLVVVDDVHLDLGALRMRPSGSAGGHNGTQDVIDRLGTQQFPRLRIGIGNDYPDGAQSDYVLAPFDESQREVVDETLDTAADAVLRFAAEGVEAAMNQFNRS